MELLRVFERKCPGACLTSYRSPEWNFQKYISNTKLYNSANLNRINCFIIKLIRNHYSQINNISENSLISGAAYSNDEYIRSTMITGFIPPEAFPFLDTNGYILDEKKNPIIYHFLRIRNDKIIVYDSHLDGHDPYRFWWFNNEIRDKDKKKTVNVKKYW